MRVTFAEDPLEVEIKGELHMKLVVDDPEGLTDSGSGTLRDLIYAASAVVFTLLGAYGRQDEPILVVPKPDTS